MRCEHTGKCHTLDFCQGADPGGRGEGCGQTQLMTRNRVASAKEVLGPRLYRNSPRRLLLS